MSRLSNIIGVSTIVVGAVAAIVVAFFVTVATERRSIEEVRTVLEINDLDWVEVSANGLQVILAGTAPSEASHFRAISQTGTVIAPNRVVNAMQVAIRDTSTPPRFSVDMLRNDDGIQLIGLVPEDNDPALVLDALGRVGGDVEVTNMIETAAFPMPDRWEAALRYGLRALEQLPRSKVTVFDGRVEVQAVSDSVAQRADFLASLERGQPRGVEIILDISAPRPVITPFAVRFVMDGESARFETCAAPSVAARDQILAAAADAGAEGVIPCDIGLGAPSQRWGEAVSAGLAALAELGAGSISFSDVDVTLVAVQGSSQAEFDRVVGELDSALPPVFSLRGVLPDPPLAETDAVEQTPRFFADLSETGQLRVRGRVPEGPLGASIASYARATFGHVGADVATRAVPDLPEGWAVRAMAGLDALSRTHAGRLTLEPDLVSLTGVTGDPDGVSEIARLLTERLGPSATFDLNVSYDESLDPIAALPTAEECVAQIQAIQDEAKITFEPGSVEITEAAGEILDRIALILPECRHVRMEISGHTDSQGREEMNLNLSQSRADAVLNGLLARNVLVSNLTAQGYGESQPLESNDTEAGRERNRRIEFRLLVEPIIDEDGIERGLYAPVERPEIDPVPRPDSVLAAAGTATPATEAPAEEEE